MKTNELIQISAETLAELHAMMLRIRLFEERVAELLDADEIKCPTHLYIGQEAIASGVCANLKKEDYVFSTHRSHGHYIAKGGQLKPLMAELYGKSTGCSRGRGGSMHIVAPEVGYLGSSAIVAGSIPLALGTALASWVKSDGKVTVAFFGDGATDEGVFYECLSFASLNKLPVVFVCENNLFSTHLPIQMRHPADNIYEKAGCYMMPSVRIDGNDVLEVYKTARPLIEGARNGLGPALIEARTYRWRSHVGPWWDLDVGFRKKEEVESWVARCPIKALEKVMMAQGDLSEAQKDAVYQAIQKEVEDSLVFAKESPFPDPSELMKNVYADSPAGGQQE